MGVHRKENIVIEKKISFMYQWGYTGMKTHFLKICLAAPLTHAIIQNL